MSAWRACLLWTWWFDRGCGYDLAGLPAGPDGRVTCPECGERTAARGPGERAPRRVRWLAARVGVVMAVWCASLAGWKNAYLRSCRWAKHAPTPVLLALERAAPRLMNQRVRWELHSRMKGNTLSQWSTAQLDALAIRSLRDDSVVGNAEWAIDVLSERLAAKPGLLEEALRDPDWQCQQLAGTLLRQRYNRENHGTKNLSPSGFGERRTVVSDDLLRVSVEGLRDDRLPYDQSMRRMTWVFNAKSSFSFLIDHAERAEELLLAALGSDDEQQRWLAACVLGYAGAWHIADRVAPVLVEHLGANTRSGDATACAAALFHLGHAALPVLEAARHDADSQRAKTAQLLVSRIRGDPLSSKDLRRLNVITSVLLDPSTTPDWAIEFRE